jgi:ribosomal protein S18 acetylase RimI-like enzyme
MEIIKATMKDYNEVLNLKLESKEEERKFNLELEPIEKVKKHYEEYLKNDLNSEWRAIFIAIEDEQIIGLITGKIYRTLYVCGFQRCGFISNVFVKTQFRKRKIAEKLIFEIINWFKKKNATQLSLELYENNAPAINLYHKLGFKNYSIKMRKKI